MPAHRPETPPGQECPGCAPYDLPAEPRMFLVVAGHGPAVSVCAHYHAEHSTNDYYTACQLVTDLRREGHASVEMYRRDEAGKFHHSSSTTGPANGHCRPCATEYDSATACRVCGDPMAHWTHPEAVPA